MEAPDKIYLHPDIGGREFIRPWLRRAANSESVAYIRKDALLEWASGELLPGYSAQGKGWNLALQTLIDKLNEM